MASVAVLGGGAATAMGAARNMMYSGAVINSGANSAISSLPPIDMTCWAFNSTHYMCKVVTQSQSTGEIPDVIGFPLAIVCGFLMFVVAVIICKCEGWI